MPLASLRCRSDHFDDERLNQKVIIATLKNLSVELMTSILQEYRTLEKGLYITMVPHFSELCAPLLPYALKCARKIVYITRTLNCWFIRIFGWRERFNWFRSINMETSRGKWVLQFTNTVMSILMCFPNPRCRRLPAVCLLIAVFAKIQPQLANTQFHESLLCRKLIK